MLIQFTAENFLSFKDKVVFSMFATNDENHSDHLAPYPQGKNKHILRTAAIYGANASGKSNLVKAMAFARRLIVQGTEPNETIGALHFRLGSQSEQPTRFQFVFLMQSIEYTYGFSLKRSEVWQEYLYANQKGTKVTYFERDRSNGSESTAYFGPSVTKNSQQTLRFLQYKAADTRPNQLLLAAIFEGNIKDRVVELKPVMEWFRSVLTIISAESEYRHLEVRTHETEALKEFLGKLLRACGTGISEVVTAENVLDWDRDLPGIPSSEREKITQLFTAQSGDASTPTTMVEIDMKGSNRFYLRQNEQGELLLLKLLLKHEGEQRQAIDFHMNDESDGTQRIIHLAPMLFDISEGRERVIVIDELDRRLHPYLSRLVVQTVLQCAFNNQLLFTTHETSLLDLELLRRDEIWFVEKNESGSSHLYSLAEFKVRPDLQIEKGYLNGRFGAVPFVGDIVSLGWNDKTDAVREYARAK